MTRGGQRRPPLQSRTGTVRNGTSRTPSPTKSQGGCAMGGQSRPPLQTRNDSAARWERRDTWAPPYGVRRSSRADRVVRPYKAKQEPRKTGRRGRRPLRNHKGCVQRGGQRRPPLQGRTGAVRNGTSGTPSPTKSQGVCAMGGQGRPPLQGKTGTAQNGTACPTNRRGAARTAKFRNFFFPLSASAGLRRLYSDDTGRPSVL